MVSTRLFELLLGHRMEKKSKTSEFVASHIEAQGFSTIDASFMRSGAYQQPAWCWHLVWGSKGSKIQKKQFHADLQKSNWKRIYCVMHIIWRVPHSYGTGFGRFLEPGVLTCATRPHDTVTQWPLSLPLGDLSMVLGNYRWDAQREMNRRRVKAKEFDYRALLQCRMATELLVYS